MTMKLRNVPFSPPDMTEAETNEVRDAILSGWITTGPRVKKLEKMIADYVGVDNASDNQKTPNVVCLNSATAAMEMVLHLLGVGPGDEVIVPAYTYTASASVITHVGATIKMVDIQKGNFEMDYDLLADAITEDKGGCTCRLGWCGLRLRSYLRDCRIKEEPLPSCK